MKIAHVAPLAEAIPPLLYGGTERVVSYLTDELVSLGHQVTLFASGDSVSRTQLDVAWPRALRLDPSIPDPMAPHILMLERVFERAAEFDVIHSHIDYLGYPMLRRCGVPFVSTLHGRLDLPTLPPLYEAFRDVPVVSISDAQRTPLPMANYVATIYHGLPEKLLTPGFGTGGYLAFLGRISPEKAPDAAIRIAARTGLPLRIAAKVDKIDREYFNSVIKPLLSLPNVEYIGEINDAQKSEFLGNAVALLFPIDWPEPFGLTMIEAMACGTPVIARRRGSVPEVVDEGVTGFIFETEDEAVSAIERLPRLNRVEIRHVFEKRFSARRMAENYLQVYRRLVADRPVLRQAV